MCNTSGCCPSPEIFQEKICGNFTGTGAPVIVWTAPVGGYFAGTFEIFNSSASPTTVIATTTSTPVGALSASSGNSDSASVNAPVDFTITADVGNSGTFCISLYKRILP